MGCSAVQLLAKRGANVVVVDINDQAGEESVALTRQNSRRAIYVRCNIASEDDVKDIVAATQREFGQLHGAGSAHLTVEYVDDQRENPCRNSSPEGHLRTAVS